MNYRDEDPARTGNPDRAFNSFMSDLTGRDADDLDLYEKRPIMPDTPMTREMAQCKIDTDNFLRNQINRFSKSSEQRDSMLKLHGLEV